MAKIVTKRAKYGNKKVVINGITFDSIKEGDIYLRLLELESRGVIRDLEIHPMWELQPKLTETYIKHLKTKDKVCERTVLLPITYTADFSFWYGGEFKVVDVKSTKAMLPKDYRLKKKMLRYVHGLEITEVYNIKDLDIYR